MSKKELAAKIILYLGAIGLAGMIIRGAVAAYPLTTTTYILMMAPYTYIRFRHGLQEGRTGQEAA